MACNLSKGANRQLHMYEIIQCSTQSYSTGLVMEVLTSLSYSAQTPAQSVRKMQESGMAPVSESNPTLHRVQDTVQAEPNYPSSCVLPIGLLVHCTIYMLALLF